MGNPKEEGTDQASIRPVSSLRSLFEEAPGIQPPSSSSIPSRTPARPNHKESNVINTTRASLDVPRTSSPWLSADDDINLPRRCTPGPPIPRPRRPQSKILQRPLSTTSLSPSQPGDVQQSLSMSAPRSPIHSPRIHPPTLLSDPPGKVKQPIASHTQAFETTSKKSSPESRLGRQTVDRGARGIPPPINRADKPKIPSKPTLVPPTFNLEPLGQEPEKKVSPFSTPPSSDESPSRKLHSVNVSSAAEGPRIRPRQSPQKGANGGTVGPAGLVQRAVSKQDTPFEASKLDPRAYGSRQAINTHNPVAELPPQLPPRRGHDQGSSTPRHAVEASGYPHIKTHTLPPSGMHRSTAIPEQNLVFPPPPKNDFAVMGSSDASFPYRANVLENESRAVEHNLPLGTGDRATNNPESSSYISSIVDYPDLSSVNRRQPFIKFGQKEINTSYEPRLADICGRYVVTTGHVTNIWDAISGKVILSLGQGEREVRMTSLAFKPAAKASEEGSVLWLGTNYGEIQEIDIPAQRMTCNKKGPHESREIVKIYRHQGSMWTLDEGGRLCIWAGDEAGLPSLQCEPVVQRVPKNHTYSLIVFDTLWLATGKDIRVFRPSPNEGIPFSVLHEPLCQTTAGAVTSGAVIDGQLDRVYFGHADGKVSIYSITNFTCLGVVSVSVYKITCLAGAGHYLWAGYNTGAIHVYDTRTQPWIVKKDWAAHNSPTLNIVADRSSLWKEGVLRVVSLGADNALRFWDGTLRDDWLDDDMRGHDFEYCSFKEITALVMTWNAGATTPTDIRYDEIHHNFFQTLLQTDDPPDLLVFGFQELVDLEDKRLTARTLFKGNKKKGPSEHEHMSHQYRTWRDYLVRCVEDTMPSSEPYQLLHTASMVGLFTCVFIRNSQRTHIRGINAGEVKRGMGGLHGNKGALILRFTFDDSSICLVNCHLAAGQTQTNSRNQDFSAILDSEVLPRLHGSSIHNDVLVGGGDGSMILDHDICILNGDLNYRIDTMGRDTVIKAINAKNLSKLLERDQLLVSRRRHPGLRIRAFKESPITFAPTYKFDVGSDIYDTSEKRRAPAWCDRILYRGSGKVKQLEYRRHDLKVSDHRPVSGRFRLRVKTVLPEEREKVFRESEERFVSVREQLATESKIEYLRDVLGVPAQEARRLI